MCSVPFNWQCPILSLLSVTCFSCLPTDSLSRLLCSSHSQVIINDIKLKYILIIIIIIIIVIIIIIIIIIIIK